MSDSGHAPLGDANIFGGAEPARDAWLGALLGDVVGAAPADDVNWHALAARISAARARQRAAWWNYAARWERSVLPAALVAGLVGALALWRLGMPATARAAAPQPSDAVAAMLDGASTAEAARTWTSSLGSADDATTVEIY